MKELRIEATLNGVAVVVSKEFPVEVPSELEEIVKKGMASDLYRGGASHAWKGLDHSAKEALTFDDKVKRITAGCAEVGLKLVSSEVYVAPERVSETKIAAQLVAKAKADGKLPKLAKVVGFKGDVVDEAAFIQAVHEWRKDPTKAL